MEENRKGNTLYAVLGVATLVVAIIGATFAYFSASASNTTEIQGGTSNVSLDLIVKRVMFDVDEEEDTNYNNLVPAIMTISNEGIQSVLDQKCEANGYTGCHLYKITASSTSALKSVDLLLYSFNVTGATDKNVWKFVVFTGTESTTEGRTTYTNTDLVTTSAQKFEVASGTTASAGYNIYNGTDIAAGTKDFYLLVYLEDNDKVQNSSEGEDAQYLATGTYTGSVAFVSAEGKVTANFTTSLSD